MTNTGGTPAGWYYAPGDPEGTQRYWDGAQWIGEPQVVQPQPPAPAPAPDPEQTVQYRPQQDTPPAAGYDAPGASPQSGFSDPGAGAPPSYGVPGAAAGGPPPSYGVPGAAAGGPPPNYGAGAPGAQPGYQQPPPGFGAPGPGAPAFVGSGGTPGTPAEFGDRAIAYLIDIAPIIVVYIVILIAGVISDVLGVLVSLVGYLAVLAYVIWNMYIKQGSTGQSIGKEQRGIKLVADGTAEPVGALMAFVRYLLVGAFIFACCIGYPINLLSPLWNADKKTYSDKILSMSVIKA